MLPYFPSSFGHLILLVTFSPWRCFFRVLMSLTFYFRGIGYWCFGTNTGLNLGQIFSSYRSSSTSESQRLALTSQTYAKEDGSSIWGPQNLQHGTNCTLILVSLFPSVNARRYFPLILSPPDGRLFRIGYLRTYLPRSSSHSVRGAVGYSSDTVCVVSGVLFCVWKCVEADWGFVMCRLFFNILHPPLNVPALCALLLLLKKPEFTALNSYIPERRCRCR